MGCRCASPAWPQASPPGRRARCLSMVAHGLYGGRECVGASESMRVERRHRPASARAAALGGGAALSFAGAATAPALNRAGSLVRYAFAHSQAHQFGLYPLQLRALVPPANKHMSTSFRLLRRDEARDLDDCDALSPGGGSWRSLQAPCSVRAPSPASAPLMRPSSLLASLRICHSSWYGSVAIRPSSASWLDEHCHAWNGAWLEGMSVTARLQQFRVHVTPPRPHFRRVD